MIALVMTLVLAQAPVALPSDAPRRIRRVVIIEEDVEPMNPLVATLKAERESVSYAFPVTLLSVGGVLTTGAMFLSNDQGHFPALGVGLGALSWGVMLLTSRLIQAHSLDEQLASLEQATQTQFVAARR